MLTIADLRDFLSEEVITEEMNFSSSRRKYIASLCPGLDLDLYKALSITPRSDFGFKITPNIDSVLPQRHSVEVSYNFNLNSLLC